MFIVFKHMRSNFKFSIHKSLVRILLNANSQANSSGGAGGGSRKKNKRKGHERLAGLRGSLGASSLHTQIRAV